MCEIDELREHQVSAYFSKHFLSWIIDYENILRFGYFSYIVNFFSCLSSFRLWTIYYIVCRLTIATLKLLLLAYFQSFLSNDRIPNPNVRVRCMPIIRSDWNFYHIESNHNRERYVRERKLWFSIRLYHNTLRFPQVVLSCLKNLIFFIYEKYTNFSVSKI